MYYGKIFVLLLIIIPTVFGATDYCDADLCDKGKKHIACGNSGNIDPKCLFLVIIRITPLYRRQIIEKHNSLRNQIARGFKKFPPATRMTTMVWDNELAKLAELNVKQCKMRRDQCRNTKRFSFAGQNVAITSWKNMNVTVSKVIATQIQLWFNEYIHCPLYVIKSYNSSTRSACSRFTTIVQEKSTHIGCAISRTFSKGSKHQIMACNYAYDNILGDPVYNDGETATLCMTGTNKRFTSLCSVIERYYLE